MTTSLSAFELGAGSAPVINTSTTGLFDPLALNLPTTSSIPLADGFSVGLSSPAQVTQPQNGFPYLLTDGFSGDLFIPQDAAGNQISAETLFLSNASAFGFEVVPFSSGLGGPYTITVTLGSGQSTSVTLPGADFNTGETASAFIGYFGGPETSLTHHHDRPEWVRVRQFLRGAGAGFAWRCCCPAPGWRPGCGAGRPDLDRAEACSACGAGGGARLRRWRARRRRRFAWREWSSRARSGRRYSRRRTARCC